MNNIIRTETIETPINSLWNNFKNVILFAERHRTATYQRDLVNPGSIRNVNELYQKGSGNMEALNKLKNRKIGKNFKKQQGMPDQHVITLTTLI